MAKRKDEITDLYRSQLLTELGLVRSRLHTYQDRLTPFKDDYNAIAEVSRAIDRLAEKLTANPEYYHAANHKV
ncbi:MAG: hypothetical protein JKY94_08380 [Rhodobacteraceae bacterium]|nr:hypothetical protein [Paracoccaceae bacterium]